LKSSVKRSGAGNSTTRSKPAEQRPGRLSPSRLLVHAW